MSSTEAGFVMYENQVNTVTGSSISSKSKNSIFLVRLLLLEYEIHLYLVLGSLVSSGRKNHIHSKQEGAMSDNSEIIELLQQAYNHELEVVTNFIANSTNLDGIRAEEIKKALAADVQEELTHAQQLANRIKQIGGLVPGSGELKFGSLPQPPSDTCDVVAVIKGVIESEIAACALYNQIIKATDGIDYVTQDLCITLLADEEAHLVLFRGYLKEYERDS